jgi:hypothetical protein
MPSTSPPAPIRADTVHTAYRLVQKFQAINPHMRLTLRVKDVKGTRDIEFEGHSTNSMYRSGYRDKMINVGDTITVNIAPLLWGQVLNPRIIHALTPVSASQRGRIASSPAGSSLSTA